MNWKRAWIGVAIMIPVVALLAFGLTRDPSTIPSPLPGKSAPAFSLAVMESPTDTIRLSDLHGKVVVLNFWASWCLACRDEHEELKRSAELYQPRGVAFYGVLYNDVAENGRKYLDEMGHLPYRNLLDPKTRTAIDYGLYGVPETFFISKDGRVAYKHVGPVTVERMQQILEPLIAAQPVVGLR